jgi:hypothetical protein
MDITLETTFDEFGQTDVWRNKVAFELNVLLGRAQYLRETTNDESDQEVIEATLSIVARVAEFEEIEREN